MNPRSPPVVILGGTFDPVHYGHLRFADEVRRALGLSEVRLVPAGDPPHRLPASAGGTQRGDMLRLAVRDFPGLVVDDRELRRPGKSYTVLTLEELRTENPASPIWLLLGADAFRGLPAWHRWEALFDLAHLIIVERPGTDLTRNLPAGLAIPWEKRRIRDPSLLFSTLAGFIYEQHVLPQAISATAIRMQLARGPAHSPELAQLLPPAVLAYIDRHRLYRPPTDAT